MLIDSEKNNIPLETQPNLIIDPLGDSISSIELVRISGSDVDVVNAARVSYGKYSQTISERDSKLIAFLMEHEHTSPFEHNQLSFRVKCPLFVARQWMRHRMNSYNEISYRYVQAPLEFYTPPKWREQDTKNKQASIGSFDNEELTAVYKKALDSASTAYETLLQAGIGRELARGVLPSCTYTQFIFTCNLHSLMHFMRLRMHAGAQYEIRQYAKAMLQLSNEHFSVSINAWKQKYMKDLDFEFDSFTQQFSKTAE